MVTEMLGGASYPYRKEKETHGLFVIVASSFMHNDDDGVAQDGGHNPAIRLRQKHTSG